MTRVELWLWLQRGLVSKVSYSRYRLWFYLLCSIFDARFRRRWGLVDVVLFPKPIYVVDFSVESILASEFCQVQQLLRNGFLLRSKVGSRLECMPFGSSILSVSIRLSGLDDSMLELGRVPFFQCLNISKALRCSCPFPFPRNPYKRSNGGSRV